MSTATPSEEFGTTKIPVLLVVFVETSRLRWFVAAIGQDGVVLPLVCSEEGNLSPYLDLSFDEQVAFLRHRLCGVLQRGCDRLWARMKKAQQIAIVLERPLDRCPENLTQRVADHFVEWMSNPPVAFFVREQSVADGELPRLNCLAGELTASWQSLLSAALTSLLAATADSSLWELYIKPVS
jgi:hypothetical protein